jgi:hypothetical protein
MNYLALKGEVSDFSSKNLSLDRKLRTRGPTILRGFIPRNLCIDKKFALKGGVLYPYAFIRGLKGRVKKTDIQENAVVALQGHIRRGETA